MLVDVVDVVVVGGGPKDTGRRVAGFDDDKTLEGCSQEVPCVVEWVVVKAVAVPTTRKSKDINVG